MRKYELDTAENQAFVREVGERLLSFGRAFPSPGGGSYYLGDDGTPWKERPRETWITSRMCHVYGIGSMMGYDGADALADAALEGLLGELRDTEHGGWYAGRTADGGILPTKQCYAHAFVILAATTAILAKRPRAEELLKEALTTYDKYFWDEELGLSKDTWNTEFTECDSYRGLNANMHSVEAFLAVTDATGDVEYRKRAERIITRVIAWARNNDWRIPEHFNEAWEPQLELNRDKPDDPFKPYGATPGHGIEWARLITQWAAATYGEQSECAKDYYRIAKNLYRRAMEDAWNVDGAPGICYTTGWDGKPIVHDRMHWTLAEAINTSATLYRVTEEDCFAKDYQMLMEYLDTYVLDHEHGSWYHQLNEKNELLGTVWPGKSDLYHAFQATLIPYNPLVGVSIAAVIAKHPKVK